MKVDGKNFVLKPIEVRVGRGGPKCFLTAASFERTAQRRSLPHPNSRGCGQFIHVQASQGRSLDLCVGDNVHSSTLPSSFPAIHSIRRTIFYSKGSPEEFKLSNGVLRLGISAVAASLCLEDPIWPPSTKEVVTQQWGRPGTSPKLMGAFVAAAVEQAFLGYGDLPSLIYALSKNVRLAKTSALRYAAGWY